MRVLQLIGRKRSVQDWRRNSCSSLTCACRSWSSYANSVLFCCICKKLFLTYLILYMADLYSKLHRQVSFIFKRCRSKSSYEANLPYHRNNVPAARENGLVRDLNLTGNQYPSLLSLLYVGYILFQVCMFDFEIRGLHKLTSNNRCPRT